MADLNSDIAADFIIEAGEIIDNLGEQLVELENQPNDKNLLNTIFRGFHTIKGGAGFLHIVAMIDVCHAAEEVFDALRSGKLEVDSALFDLVMQTPDELQRMIAEIKNGRDAGHAPAELVQGLRELAKGIGKTQTAVVQQTSIASDTHNANEEITDDEFESLLDSIQGKDTTAIVGSAGDSITDDEFEALLDTLQNQNTSTTPQNDKSEVKITSETQLHTHEQPAKFTPQIADKKAPEATPREAAEPTIRVETKRLDIMMNLIGELVLARNRLKALHRRAHDADIDRAVGTLDLITGRLQTAVMKTRMQPIGRVFSRFPKVARDVARTLNKEVKLELKGEETELDKNMVEALADPLVHLVRNSIDHGVESPEKREKMGKPRQGMVCLSAQHEADHMLITVQDDGAGMDPELLRNKAREKGLLTADAAARLSTEECFHLIFLPGFSTKSEVSEISGRGVGMDVVKSKLNELNGQVSIDSARGSGTKISIKLPLTLAILTTLIVQSHKRPYALPLSTVEQVFPYDASKLLWVNGREMLDVRGITMPLIFLRRWLNVSDEQSVGNVVVVIHSGELHYGLVVDLVCGRDEAVIKPLPSTMRQLSGFSGATITGDGGIALILDVHSIYQAACVS